MARMADARSTYASDKVTTSPERLVTMLYDRLVRDLVAGEQAMSDLDRERANTEIQHAQAIIIELLHSLDTSTWPAAKELSLLYSWLIQQLLQANVRQDADQIRVCRQLVEPLAEAWHQAAGRTAARSFQRDMTEPGQSIGAAV